MRLHAQRWPAWAYFAVAAAMVLTGAVLVGQIGSRNVAANPSPQCSGPVGTQDPDGGYAIQLHCDGVAPLPTTAEPSSSPSPSPTVPPTTTPPPSTTTPPVITTSPPSPTPTPSPTGTTPPPPLSFDPAWWEANTGVPPFTVLTAYTGPCTITVANTVISDKDMRAKCPNGVTIRAPGVVIQRSMLRNLVSPDSGTIGSVRAEQVDIDGGQSSSFPTVAYQGVTLVKANVHGGQHSLQCSGNCSATDSWFHDTWLPDSSGAHENGIISNGGAHGLFVHNRIQCDHPGGNPSGGGCTGDAVLLGDFGRISDWTFRQNLFMTTGGSYCTYAGNASKPFPVADHIVYTDNVFQKAYPTNNGHQAGSPGCAYYGPVTGFPGSSSAGNVWTGNVFDTGGVVSPA